MEIPPDSLNFNKEKGKYHANVNILGIAYKPDGSVGARFNDTVNLDLEKDEWKEFTKVPYRYQNQFDAAPGTYKLTVVLSGGGRSEEHTSELQSHLNLVCRLLLEKKKNQEITNWTKTTASTCPRPSSLFFGTPNGNAYAIHDRNPCCLYILTLRIVSLTYFSTKQC